MRILFIGNSYTFANDLPRMITQLAAAGPKKVRIEHDRQLEGGQSLKGHWDKGVAPDKIRKGGWDVVVLQDQSMMPFANPNLTSEYGVKFHAEIQQAKARTLFYMTWARKNNPSMIDKLSQTYLDVAAETKSDVAPVGLAWKAAIEQRKDLELYVADGSHPSPAGTYLAACVFYARLLQADPRDLPPDTVKSVPSDLARFLQKIAWETVNAK